MALGLILMGFSSVQISLAQDAPIKVKILSSAPACCEQPSIYLARKTFADAGLDVDWGPPTPGASTAMQLALSGAEDIVQISNAGAIAAAGAGQPAVIFAATQIGIWYGFAVTDATFQKFASAGLTPDSPIADRVKAMKGLRVWCGQAGGNREIKYRQAFKSFGLDPENDITCVNGSDDAGFAAWRSQQVDAYDCCDPTALKTLPSSHIWVHPGELPTLLTGYRLVYATSEQYAKDHPEVLKRVVAGLTAARDMVKAGVPGSPARNDVLKILDEQNPAVDPADVAGSYDNNREHNLIDPGPLKKSIVQQTIDDYNLGPAPVQLTPEQLVVPGFMDANQ
jgi:NitT/TauT family transport system substrate-binding protein